MIDTLRITRRLTGAGLERRQAEALASMIFDLNGQSRTIKAELRLTVSELTGVLEKTKAHLVASQLIVAVALLIALKLIR